MGITFDKTEELIKQRLSEKQDIGINKIYWASNPKITKEERVKQTYNYIGEKPEALSKKLPKEARVYQKPKSWVVLEFDEGKNFSKKDTEEAVLQTLENLRVDSLNVIQTSHNGFCDWSIIIIPELENLSYETVKNYAFNFVDKYVPGKYRKFVDENLLKKEVVWVTKIGQIHWKKISKHEGKDWKDYKEESIVQEIFPEAINKIDKTLLGESNKKINSVFTLKEGVPVGKRNESCFKIACSHMRKGNTPEDTLVLMESWNKNNSVPMLQEEIKKCVESAYSYDKGEKEEIRLPKSGRLISNFINDIIDILIEKELLFFRTDSRQIVEIGKIEHDNEDKKIFTGFIAIKPSRFITLVERYFTPGYSIKTEDDFIFKPKSMTKDLANTVIDSYILEESLSNIDRIFTIPIPIMYNEKLTFPKVGYDKRFKSWLPFNSPKITNTKMNLKDSKDLLHTIIKEFCFQTDEDYNMAIAALITPFLRGLYHSFNCRTPVFIYLANRERVGKDYLAGISGILYEGIALEEPPISIARNKGNADEELRKKILSAFLSGRKRLHFANNKGFINNAVFEGIVTAKTYSDRLLGKNETPIFDNELEFSLSGNIGIGFTPDLSNRSRSIRQFYDKEDTNSRMFESPNLHKWVFDNRDLILSAVYGLVRNWVEKGSPDGTIKFASFPEWARVCGGIMESTGYESPCKPNKEMALGGDSETIDMKLLFEYCYEEKPDEPLTKQDIKEIIEKEDIFSYLDFSKKADQTKFGKKIIKFVGRVLSDIRMRVVDNSVRSSRQKYVFSKEISTYGKDGNLGNLCNLRAITDYKTNKNIYRGNLLPKLPKLPKTRVFEYINNHEECSFADIHAFLDLQENELIGILKALKKSGEIFEPKNDKYLVV